MISSYISLQNPSIENVNKLNLNVENTVYSSGASAVLEISSQVPAGYQLKIEKVEKTRGLEFVSGALTFDLRPLIALSTWGLTVSAGALSTMSLAIAPCSLRFVYFVR